MVKVHGSCVNHSITSKASRKLRFDSLNIWQKHIVIVGARRNKKQERSDVSLECFREWLNYSLKEIFNIFFDIIKKKEKRIDLKVKGQEKILLIKKPISAYIWNIKLKWYVDQNDYYNKCSLVLKYISLYKMARFVLQNNYFEFNGIAKQKISGTTFGTEFTPTYACIFMDKLETDFLISLIRRSIYR